MNVIFVFSSSEAAETAFLDYFQDSSDYMATLNYRAATIAIDCGGAPIGAGIHLEIPDGLIALIL